jgi:hypothetical protein
VQDAAQAGTFIELPGLVEGSDSFWDTVELAQRGAAPPVRLGPRRGGRERQLSITQRLRAALRAQVRQRAVRVELVRAALVRAQLQGL